jgi:phosphate-selective porin OprO/OprP
MRLSAALLAALASPALAQEAARPDGIRWDGLTPTLQLADGNFTLAPKLRLDADAGSFFGQEEPGGYRSGVNLRRGRLGVTGTVLRDFTYDFTWEFGGSSPNDYSNLYEAQIAYRGFQGVAIRAGAFQLQHLPEYAGSSFDLPFMERAAISNIAASLASGSTRLAAGVEANGAIGGAGARWNISAYGTGGVASTPHDQRQRGLVGRAVVLAVDQPGLQLQFGVDVAAQFHPGTSPGPESIRLRDYPELRVDTRRFLDSGTIRADGAWAAGPEFAGRIGRFYAEAVWQRVEVDTVSGPDRRYEGWYAELLYPLRGRPRERASSGATWKRPMPEDRWGALEIGARYSAVKLRDGGQGARQGIWTVGLNWYPTEQLRFTMQYENGTTRLSGPDRDFQAIGLRAAFNL